MIFSIILFASLSVNYIMCDTYNTKGHQRNVRLVRETYKYNHPPTVENDEPIPVAVVYGEDNNRERKTVTINEDSKLSEKQSNLDIVEELSVSANDTNHKIKSTDGSKIDDHKETPRSTSSAFQIPVAVVYETKLTTERIQRNYKSNDKRGYELLRRGQRRPQLNSTEINKSTVQVENLKSSISEASATKKEIKNAENESEIQNNKENPKKTSVSQIVNKNDQIKGKSSKRTRERDPVIPIVEMENHVYSHTGEFQYSYEGGDGTKAFEKGELKLFDDEKTGEAVVGGFSYRDKDGNDFSLSYTADENGYRPVGAHLPTPPPIPPAIARALKYLATKTTPEEDNITEKTKN